MADSGGRTRLGFLLDRAGTSPERFRTQFHQHAKSLGVPVTVSSRTVYRWITAGALSQLPRAGSRRVLEHMFGEGVDELLSGYPRHDNPEPARTPAPITGPAQTPGPVIDAEIACTPADITEVIAMAADETAQFGMFAEATNVGPSTLAQLHADLTRIATRYPHSDVFTKFVEARDLARRAYTLLSGHQHPAQTRDLYLIAAGAAAIQSNAAFDLGEFDAAGTHARMSFLYAELAGHNGMRCWARGMEALIAYWQDQPRLAADIAADAWRYQPETGTAHIRLAAIEARARARLRDQPATLHALQRADAARASVVGVDDPGGMMAFPLSKQHLYVSTSLLWLGGPSHLREAESHADAAIAIYQSDPPEHRRHGETALARVDLALTRLARSDLDGAADQLDLVLEGAGARRTEPIARRLRHVRAALERPYLQTSALATSLSERLASSPIQPSVTMPTLIR